MSKRRLWGLFKLKRSFCSPTGVQNPVDPEPLRKARRMAPTVGFMAGVFGATVGVGGGVVIVPAIVNACKTIPQRVVSGTSLAAVLSTATASAATYAQAGCIDFGAASIISPVAMLLAPFGARATMRFDCQKLRRMLGYFLIAVAPLVPLKAYLLSTHSNGYEAAEVTAEEAKANAQSEDPFRSLAEKPVHVLAGLVLTGAVAGFASGLLGIGGGTIVTPLLAVLMPQEQTTILGTSLLSMIPPSAVALAQHAKLGNVDWRMALGLAGGTAIGGAIGSAAAIQAPPGILELCFAIGMLFLGRRTLMTAR
jgi:uncharacterized membrane protein YfcA